VRAAAPLIFLRRESFIGFSKWGIVPLLLDFRVKEEI
jgi:hypothetical protein